MSNLATPMTFGISSRVGRLLVLLDCVCLGVVGMPEGGWGCLLVRNCFGRLPFLIGHKLLIGRPGRFTDISEIKPLIVHSGVSLGSS